MSANAAERGAAVAVPEVGWAVSAPVEPGWAARSAPAATGGEIVVHRGDSLWSIAERRCGPGADPAQVLAEQQRLHAVNAGVIGDDPDRIVPGQVLRLS
nr:LysM peptidoglycan-binding domain-containing protein [Kineococcus aurantiacus]